MRVGSIIAALLVLAGVASADIFEWQDGEGVRHYTNLRELLPPDQRDGAKVFVEAAPASEGQATTAEETEAKNEREPRPDREGVQVVVAPVVYDQSALEAAYSDGLRAGLEAARRVENASPPVSVRINGPFVAAVRDAAPYFPYYASEPLVTTSFDRGRSRHRTLRMLLQDQFALDREGPYVYRERFLPPHHRLPAPLRLQPFLTRGLPHAPAPSALVITR